MAAGQRAKPKYNMGQNVLFMTKLAWTTGEKKVILLSLLLASATVVLNLLNLYLPPTILSAVERQVSVSELLGTIALFVLALMAVSALQAYIQENTLYGRLAVRTELIARLNHKASTTSYPNLFEERFQKLGSRCQMAVSSNAAATEAVWATLTELVQNLLGFGIYVVLLSSVQPVLMVVILVTAAISYGIGRQLNEWGYRHREEEGVLDGHLSYLSRCSSDPAAAKDIRMFGLVPWIRDLQEKAMGAYTAFQQRAQGVYVWTKIADLVFAFLRNGLAYAYLIHLVWIGSLDVPQFLLYFTAASGFTAWVTGILWDFYKLHKQSLDLSTVREYLDYEEPFSLDSGEPIPEQQLNTPHEIRLEHVSYRYPGTDQNILNDVSLTIHPGEKIAIVGRNGAGKTTLIKLICGFLDPTEGRILLDGRDIRTFRRRSYYGLFSAVFQTFSLLAESLAVNVAGDTEGMDRDRVRDAVSKAGLADKIASLPDGLDTKLNRTVYEDAVQLSGGETQRLMLARALYKDAPFLVLDEPTAALDPIAESDLYQKYSELTHGKSSLYISHRLASTRFCDRILLIADGGIAEEGTHEELLQQGGQYADLFAIQSRYYQEGGADDAG